MRNNLISRICLQKHTIPEEHYVFAKADQKKQQCYENI